MNYIYDILVNLQDKNYDFYDWNNNDEVLHIRKIPLFHISSNTFQLLRENQTKVTDEFLKRIYQKTERFTNKNAKPLEYVCLLSDGLEVLAVEFNRDGIVRKKSHLMVDEDSEVVEVCGQIEEIALELAVLKKDPVEPFKTRHELEAEIYIKRELKQIQKQGQLEKLKYLYYECFNKKGENKEAMMGELIDQLSSYDQGFKEKLYRFFKLTSFSK